MATLNSSESNRPYTQPSVERESKLRRRPDKRRDHNRHAVVRGKLEALLINPPDGGRSRRVYAYDDVDWDLVHLNRKLTLACPTCGARLVAHQVTPTTRVFKLYPKSICKDDVVEISTDPASVRPHGLGGGPEGPEHKWVKRRLARIVESLDLEAIVEHTPTHGDVYLPESGIVLEYQRWNTALRERTRSRTLAGAAKTIWLFPEDGPMPAPDQVSDRRRAFDREVRQRGAMYLSALDSKTYEPVAPWVHNAPDTFPLLFVSGSTVRYNAKRKALMECRMSAKTVLRQIASGERILKPVPVCTLDGPRMETRPVWVLRSDLTKWHEEQRRRRAALAEINARKATPAAGNTDSLTLVPVPVPVAPTSSPEAPVEVEQPQSTESACPEPLEQVNPWLTPTASDEKVNPWLATVPATPSETPKPVAPIPEPDSPESAAPSELGEPARRNVWDRVVAWFRRL